MMLSVKGLDILLRDCGHGTMLVDVMRTGPIGPSTLRDLRWWAGEIGSCRTVYGLAPESNAGIIRLARLLGFRREHSGVMSVMVLDRGD